MQGRAILGEQPAELGERLEVAAVGEGGNTEGPPGAGGNQPAFGWIDGGERPVGVPACRGAVAAQGSGRWRRALAFQQVEGAADGLAAGGRSGLVGDGGCVREGVPGQGRWSRDASSATEMSADRAAGALARPGQRRPGVAAGGQPKLGVRGDREGADGEILHPVRLAGGNGGRSGRYQPACLVCRVGAEFGRAFHGQRRGGRRRGVAPGQRWPPAAMPRARPGAGPRRPVPGPPVGLVVQGVRELTVRSGRLGEGRWSDG